MYYYIMNISGAYAELYWLDRSVRAYITLSRWASAAYTKKDFSGGAHHCFWLRLRVFAHFTDGAKNRYPERAM